MEDKRLSDLPIGKVSEEKEEDNTINSNDVCLCVCMFIINFQVLKIIRFSVL